MCYQCQKTRPRRSQRQYTLNTQHPPLNPKMGLLASSPHRFANISMSGRARRHCARGPDRHEAIAEAAAFAAAVRRVGSYRSFPPAGPSDCLTSPWTGCCPFTNPRESSRPWSKSKRIRICRKRSSWNSARRTTLCFWPC
jgi:hypothetical protein